MRSGSAVSRTIVTPPGLSTDVWRSSADAAPEVRVDQLVRRLDLPAETPLVVFSAHPDDETIGCGRLIAQWARQVGPCTAVLATLGEACVDHVAERPPGLAARRLREWRSATSRLGITRSIVLGLDDGRLTDERRKLRERIDLAMDQVARSGRPPVLCAPYRRDPHPDHQAMGTAVARVGRRRRWPVLQYPIWLTYWVEPGRFGGSLERVRVDERADRAHGEAVACFTSQLAPLTDDLTPVVPEEMLAHHTRQLLVRGGRR